MANYAAGVNPEVLKWARERAGMSVEDVASAMGKPADAILSWEKPAGATPTYGQLEKLAYSLYRRPIALFFFPAPPDEPDAKESFRTLPDFEIDNLLPDTRHAIRQAQAIQIALTELNLATNPSKRLIFRDITLDPTADVASQARAVREYLGLSLATQVEWGGTERALEAWRAVVQDSGVFVFKRPFKQDDISGFCITDDEFPVIYLNNSTAKSRQIFTLFHELAHVLVHTGGVTKVRDEYIAALSGVARDIELFCNRFTAEFLVPSVDFEGRLEPRSPINELVVGLAEHYKVSREVILRKLRDRKMVDSEYYEAMTAQWAQEYGQLMKDRPPGGNYYITQAAYLGDKYLDLAFSKYYQGAVTIEQLADYLAVKVRSVAGIEQAMLRKAARR